MHMRIDELRNTMKLKNTAAVVTPVQSLQFAATEAASSKDCVVACLRKRSHHHCVVRLIRYYSTSENEKG